MLQLSGHPYAQPSVQRDEQHRHGAGCGHQQTAQPAAVQRSAVHDVLNGGGRPLDEPVREEMEARLGADFSDVRIHDDSTARASAAEVGARAYTSGSHVVIGDGGGDKHTLAHELTHVIQQRQGPVAGTDNGSGLKVSDPSDRFERAAEANATRVMSRPVGPVQRTTESVEAKARTGSGIIQRAGGHAQGDHVFNKFYRVGDAVITALKADWAAFWGNLDTDTKRQFNPQKSTSPALVTAFATKFAALQANCAAITPCIGPAHEWGHPEAPNQRFYDFMATLAKDSTTGADANSVSYGAFSQNLPAEIANTGTAGWTLPNDLRASGTPTFADTDALTALATIHTYAETQATWGEVLTRNTFDAVAADKTRNRRVPASRRGAFDIWINETKQHFANLHQAITVAILTQHVVKVWVTATQTRMYALTGPVYDAADPNPPGAAGQAPQNAAAEGENGG
ncbi:DUF4157 domain-containing protein [Streptomyces sp. NPDC088553]|uniref:eCIS core domain-containing protein n=1 Tax=Streptomyces sp. NPDC088553 TaxID=3365864 RepID=UPI0037F4CE56